MGRLKLDGRVALITGGAKGIGRETAKGLASRGATVVIADIDGAAAEAAATALGGYGLAADVTDAARMREVVAEIVARSGRLDVVVANAGIAPPITTVRRIDADAWERTLEVDLLGVFRTVKPALEHVIAHQGHIVLVASIYSFANGLMNSSYAAAKAGVEQFGRALRLELAHTGTTLTIAQFGFVDTDLVRDAVDATPRAAELQSTLPGFVTRRITAQECGEAIAAAVATRKRRVLLPRFWRIWSALRGTINPVLDRLGERDKAIIENVRAADSD